MRRFRSLRWRLTLLSLGLLTVLLTLLGIGQYFAAREVLFRSNADVLRSEYAAVAAAFRREHPRVAATVLAVQFANELASRRTSAAIIDVDGGYIAGANAGLEPNDIPFLKTDYYLSAVRGKSAAYYLAGASGTANTYLVVLNPIRLAGGRPIGVAQLSISTDDIDRTLRLDRMLALAGSLLVLLVALIVTPLIVSRALRPLDQVAGTAGALAAGDYKQRVAIPSTGDEISNLAQAFNQMAEGVDQAFEIRRRSEERMQQFVGDASHELRTPLTAIAGYLDVLGRREVVDPDTLQASLAAMRRESDRMTRLVNDLLLLTRFESGRPPVRQSLELDRWLSDTLDELHLEDQGVRQSRTLQPAILVRADPDVLKQVVINLAQNALKYAPGAEQRWSCFIRNGRAVIQLQDTGPGIPQEDLPHIFERFYRGEKARDRVTGGSGLGLAIARSIMEAHGGSLDATSPPGSGATFSATLPLEGTG